MDAIPFLEKPSTKVLPFYVVFGDEPFLKRQVLKSLRQRVLGPEGDEFGQASLAGDKVAFAEVFDDVETASFFSPRRLIVVDNADPFVTKSRALLEKHLGRLKGPNVLALEVKTWPSNTRLAKMVPDAASISCKALASQRLVSWCVQWASSSYQKQLPQPAATLLVDLIGAEMGMLDQELLKLSIYVGQREKITVEDVDRLVGQSRAENVWKIFDVLAEGNLSQALKMLDRLLDQGEAPLALLGAIGSQLRKMAQATRLARNGISLGAALAQAGIPPFATRRAEQHLRFLGRAQAERIYDWLLEVNQGLKGGSQLPERTLLERLVIRLGRKEVASVIMKR